MSRTLARTRKISADPHPELAEAVMVSRFWRLVNITSEGECWPWTGYLDNDGYGLFVFHGRRRPAHELAYSFTYGEKRLPTLDTCHSCDNPPCCNPNHLRFGTRQSNVDEMRERDRAATPNRKLTDAQVIEMRERRASGARQKDLAEHYGITDGAVSMIVRGLQWANVGGPIQSNERHTS